MKLRQVTVASPLGDMSTGWIPATAASVLNDIVDICGDGYTVVTIYPPSDRDNKLPVWKDAKPWEGE